MGNLNTKNFDLIELTRQTAGDEQFIEMCEQRIYNQIKSVVSEAINNNIRLIRIAGPSGSGKTTSAKKVVQEIKDRGIDAYYISMDNWYKTLKEETKKYKLTGSYKEEQEEISKKYVNLIF